MEKKSQLSDILARTLQNLNLRSLIAKDYHQDISHPCYVSLCNNCHTLLYLTYFVIKSVTFCIPDALCNNNLSPFLIPDSLCNNNLSHFVIKLLCCFLRYKICQESLRNWLVTFWNEIIISFNLPTFLPTSIISLLPQDLWPPHLAGWGFKVKNHLQQSHVTLWSHF